ncbi:MAG: molybdopterin converting factor subunit 1 [Candidatus Latescibacterota bacterium]|jgi:molybdopterin converting factor subunit 1
MTIKVLFFASVRDLVGDAERMVSLVDGVTVTDLISELASAHKRFIEMVPSMMVSVNQEYVTPDTVLNDGDEVAFIPPVSGG